MKGDFVMLSRYSKRNSMAKDGVSESVVSYLMCI
jgi:hypothetical protein